MINQIIPKKKVYKNKTYNGIKIMEEDTYITCSNCNKEILQSDLLEGRNVCPNCEYHHKLKATDRIKWLCDDDSFKEIDQYMTQADPLNFEGYQEKLLFDKKKTSLNEAIICGEATINDEKCILAVMESDFRMGSMGTIVGQKIFNAAKLACKLKQPFVIYTCSGGARMQEGVWSLMQMAKTLEAFEMLNKAGLLSVVVLTNPTTGGVSASFATAADIVIAEPKAIVGFAGRKVIANTIKEELPEDFQTAEFLMKNGHIDDIVSRLEQKQYLTMLMKLFKAEQIDKKNHFSNCVTKLPFIKENSDSKGLTKAMDSLKIVRQMDRPSTLDYISYLFEDFVELHGDRMTSDDPAMITGVGFFHDRPVTVIGHQRGKDYSDNLKRNFGMPSPAGFRKARRIIEQSMKFNRPIITFVDTKGADPTAQAEMLNQSEAISQCTRQMLVADVPILSIVIGEGGSGGALAISTGNKLLMLKNAVFSVISPEGAASILWKNSQLVEKAAENLKITAQDLADFGIADGVIPEIDSDASSNVKKQAKIIDYYILKSLDELIQLNKEQIIEQRFNKYTTIGAHDSNKREEIKANV